MADGCEIEDVRGPMGVIIGTDPEIAGVDNLLADAMSKYGTDGLLPVWKII